jgi:hypothetical protein
MVLFGLLIVAALSVPVGAGVLLCTGRPLATLHIDGPETPKSDLHSATGC